MLFIYRCTVTWTLTCIGDLWPAFCICRFASLWWLAETASSSSGASFFARSRRATGDEPQGTMGRRSLARCLLPAFLCAHIFIDREREVWVRGSCWNVSRQNVDNAKFLFRFEIFAVISYLLVISLGEISLWKKSWYQLGWKWQIFYLQGRKKSVF